MIIKIVALVLTTLVSAGAIFYIINLIQIGAVHKEKLTRLKANYEQLVILQQSEHRALLKREFDYNRARDSYDLKIKQLNGALSDAAKKDQCINTDVPIDVLDQLRKPANPMPKTSASFIQADRNS